MYELAKKEYEMARPLFKELSKYHLMIDSVLDGNTPGRVYVDSKNPTTAFLWNQTIDSGWFLEGENTTDAFCNALNRLLVTKIIPEGKTFPDSHDCNLTVFPEVWQEKIDIIFKGIIINKDQRKQFTFKELKVFDWEKKIPDGFFLERIDEQFLEKRKGLKNYDRVVRDVNHFMSVKNFVKRGVGFCIWHKDTIVSMCTADYVKDNRIEIGIFTDEQYRRRGFATLTASATVQFCLEHQFTWIGWHCWSDNDASCATAEAVGFTVTLEHPVYHVWYNEFDNLLVQAWFLANREKKFGEGAALQEKAVTMRENNVKDALDSTIIPQGKGFMLYYYVGCLWAQAGEYKRAIARLNTSVDKGFTDGELLKKNEKLAGLHTIKGWKDLLQRLK